MTKLLAILLLPVAILAQGGGQAINIPIQNPSFEQVPEVSLSPDPCGPWVYEVPNWTTTIDMSGGSAGIFRPANRNPCGVSLPPDGITTAYLQDATISQDLGPLQTNDGVYTLTFFFANRYYWYPGQYRASLLIGSTPFCSTSGVAAGDFTQITLVCPAQRIAATLYTSGNLMVSLSASGYQLLPDSVSLTFTPQ